MVAFTHETRESYSGEFTDEKKTKLLEDLVNRLYGCDLMNTISSRRFTFALPVDNYTEHVEALFAFIKEVVEVVLANTPTTHAIDQEAADEFYKLIDGLCHKVAVTYASVVQQSERSPDYSYRVRLGFIRDLELTATLSFVHELTDLYDESGARHYIDHMKSILTSRLAD